jgi:exonuclease III
MIIRVMTYNVGHYNMGLSEAGFPASVLNEKLGNLKVMLMETAPDIIGIQEDAHYIDQAGKMKSPESVFSPVWSFRNGYKAETIRAKFKLVSGSYQIVNFSNGQHFRRGVFAVDGKRLLFISAHPIAKVGNGDKRKVQYAELFAHVKASAFDCCVIAGDFNTTEAADKTALKTLCDKNGFSMALGSYLPWLDTYLGRAKGQTRHSFDNILVKGAAIRSTKVMGDWYSRLYSDHVPVTADIDL